jgi:hypothetical protein
LIVNSEVEQGRPKASVLEESRGSVQSGNGEHDDSNG